MRTIEEWRARIEEQKESGLKQKDFCLSKDISIKTFSARKSRMKSSGVIRPASKKPRFIKVKSEDFRNPKIPSSAQNTLLNLQIRTKSGIAIEFPISALNSVMSILNGGEQ